MDQFELDIKVKLTCLSENRRILFAALTVEKLYPHYVAFEEKYTWGNSELLFDAITIVYQYLADIHSVSESEIKTIMSKIDLITPDMDDFGSALSSFALNACTSVHSLLKYLIDKDIDNILEIVSYALDTIDLYIQDQEDFDTLDPSRNIQIENNDFMLQEKERELRLIEKLSKISLHAPSVEQIRSLRDEQPIIDLSSLSG